MEKTGNVDIILNLQGKKADFYRDTYRIVKFLYMATGGRELTFEDFNEIVFMLGATGIANTIDNMPINSVDLKRLKKSYKEKRTEQVFPDKDSKEFDAIKNLLSEVEENMKKKYGEGDGESKR